MVDLRFKYKSVTDYLESEKPFKPQIAIVLGSGLGNFAEAVNILKSIPTNSIEPYPKSTVEGHKGFIHFAEYEGVKLLLFQGRIHFYEGYKLSDCLLPVHIAYMLGCKNLLISNAAGGVNKNFVPGDLMLNTSFNAINLKKELTDVLGLSDQKSRDNLLNCPSVLLNNKIIDSASEENIELKEGVYWFNKGPAYETPAEVRMAAFFGADAVGMSSAHEAIYGSSVGMEVSSITLVTNFAAGISDRKLSHQDVMETSGKAAEKFERLIKAVILKFK